MAIEQLFVDSSLDQHAMVAKIAEHWNLVPRLVEDPSWVYDEIKTNPDPWQKGKRVLWLTTNKGSFLKKCPGTKSYLCCGYHILHIASYCTMDCSYCILQSYFHPPVLQYFTNHKDLFSELDQAFSLNQTLRIGTGEFTDSLIWETFTDLTPALVNQFAAQDRAVLELKTKTTAIDRLEKLNHNKKTILAWSLNTPHIIKTQERKTATLDARLRAAAQCAKWGYPLAFHFDPIIIYPGCEKDYLAVLKRLFQAIRPETIVWISMGTFRFMPSLHAIIKQRFTDSNIIYGEFITGLDAKMRYFKPLRINIYRTMAAWMQTYAPSVFTYLCMEDEQIWMKSYGFSPETKGGLSAMLDDAARRHCHVK